MSLQQGTRKGESIERKKVGGLNRGWGGNVRTGWKGLREEDDIQKRKKNELRMDEGKKRLDKVKTFSPRKMDHRSSKGMKPRLITKEGEGKRLARLTDGKN